MNTEPKMKFRFGDFEGWLMGKMSWAVVDRRTREVVGMASNMSDCARIAERLYNAAKAAA